MALQIQKAALPKKFILECSTHRPPTRSPEGSLQTHSQYFFCWEHAAACKASLALWAALTNELIVQSRQSLFSHVCWGGKGISTHLCWLLLHRATSPRACLWVNTLQPEREAAPQKPTAHLPHHFQIKEERAQERSMDSSFLIRTGQWSSVIVRTRNRQAGHLRLTECHGDISAPAPYGENPNSTPRLAFEVSANMTFGALIPSPVFHPIHVPSCPATLDPSHCHVDIPFSAFNAVFRLPELSSKPSVVSPVSFSERLPFSLSSPLAGYLWLLLRCVLELGF